MKIVPTPLACGLLIALLASTMPDAHAAKKNETPVESWEQLAAALDRGQWDAAHPALAARLRNDLRNGYLQFLYALGQEQMARHGSDGERELAQVGYDNALQFAPDNYWAQLMSGFLRLQRGEYDRAQSHFSVAALDQPERWEAFYGLGVASYYRQDLPMLRLAADRALQLAPQHGDTLRLAAYAAALEGDPAARGLAHQAVLKFAGDDITPRRVGELLAQNHMLASMQYDGPDTAGGIDDSITPSQMVADVTIILNSSVKNTRYGVNLFDGLQAQYGYNDTRTRNYTGDSFSDALSRSYSRAITSGISIPQLTYSLNLFNHSNQYYGVVARPSLTAYLGRESEFFAGRTINVAVSGINLGQLQPIDVGVRMKLTPEEINGNRVRFQVSASRSFLTQDGGGTFDQSLTTYQQLVSTTADLEFGETLILSTLSENVTDNSASKVPLLGDVPGLNLFMKNNRGLQRNESLLILVTPTLPSTVRLPGSAERRARATQDLLRYWRDVIDPNTDVTAIIERLDKRRPFRKPEPGDLSLRPAHSDELVRQAIRENMRLARL